MGHEQEGDNPDWLAVHQERLQDAHARARECAEWKAEERTAQRQVYCPPVEVGQLVYLRHCPPGRNKIQDAWSPTAHKIVEIQGTKYTVEPLEGGPVKRVHRSNLRPCVGPVPVPRQRHYSATPEDEPAPSLESETEYMEPEFILEERVTCPAAEQSTTQELEKVDPIIVETEHHSDEEPESMMEGADGLELEMSDMPGEGLETAPLSETPSAPAERPEERPVPAPRRRKEGPSRGDTPVPSPRRSQRATAGKNRNPFNLPLSACNAISFSPDSLSQVLAGMVLYSSQLKGVLDRYITEDVDV